MRVVAVMNQKGGSGKTTTAVNLAAALAELGRRCLLVDLDPDAAATDWLGVDDGGKDLLEAFVEKRRLVDIIRPSTAPGVDLVPSSRWLENAEKAVALLYGEDDNARLGQLRAILSKLPERWDYVLLDPPPSFGFLMNSVVRAAQDVVAAVEMSRPSVRGLGRLVELLGTARSRVNRDLTLVAVLPCRVFVRGSNWEKQCVEQMDDMRREFREVVMPQVIRDTVRLREALGHQQPITLYDPSGTGAADYRAAARELDGRLQARNGRGRS